MDCFRLGGWLPSSAKGGPSSCYYLRQSSAPQHRHHQQSFDRIRLLSSHRPHSGASNMSDKTDQQTVDVRHGSKRVQVTISNRGLKWRHLQEYLKLELHGLEVPDEKVEKTLNEKYILTLPRRLTADELQDIDFLRGNDEDAEHFLQDLKNEKEGKELPPIPEDAGSLRY